MILDLINDDSKSQPVFTNPPLNIKVNQQGALLASGGLVLARKLLQELDAENEINDKIHLFERHKPYFESDHILTFIYNFLSGGETIADIGKLQNDPAFKKLIGAESIPDPTTAGDFLARFNNENKLRDIQRVNNCLQSKAWEKMDENKKQIATVDTDTSIHEVYGNKKEGASWSYTNQWSYSSMQCTLHETGDSLFQDLRGGNVYSSDGFAAELPWIFDDVKKHFVEVRYRADSAFYRKDIASVCDKEGVEFFITADKNGRIMKEVADITTWEPFKTKAEKKAGIKERTKKINLRKKISMEKKPDMTFKGGSEIAEFVYHPMDWENAYRFVVKRTERIDKNGEQILLMEGMCRYDYHIIVTNSKKEMSEVMKIAQGRGNQENLIKDFKYGLGLEHIPTGNLNANRAYFKIAGLAWNIKTWILNVFRIGNGAVMRFKRFLYEVIFHPCAVSKTGRKTAVLRFDPGPFHKILQKASV
jgi:hypothetical protein